MLTQVIILVTTKYLRKQSMFAYHAKHVTRYIQRDFAALKQTFAQQWERRTNIFIVENIQKLHKYYDLRLFCGTLSIN